MADGPYGAFLAALPLEARARFGDESAAVLAAHDAAARAAWADVEVAPDRFADELGRRLGAEAAPAALAALHASDVYLAIAAAAGDDAAATHVERDFLREVDLAARKVRATQEQADDVKGHLRRVLFTAEPGRGAGLADFTGRGDLRGYVRVIATRELIRALERGRREVAVADDAIFDRFAPASDAELSFVRRVTRDQVAGALRDALGRLDGHDRALLRYHLVDTWSIDRIAQVYGIHRATAARRLTAARERLGELMRGELADKLAVGEDEILSIVRLVQSKVEVSFERLLASNPAEPDPPSRDDD